MREQSVSYLEISFWVTVVGRRWGRWEGGMLEYREWRSLPFNAAVTVYHATYTVCMYVFDTWIQTCRLNKCSVLLIFGHIRMYMYTAHMCMCRLYALYTCTYVLYVYLCSKCMYIYRLCELYVCLLLCMTALSASDDQRFNHWPGSSHSSLNCYSLA